MKKYVTLGLLIALSITFICFIPSIRKGMRISNLQKELIKTQQERTRCETIQSGTHQKAENIRNELSGLLGLTGLTMGTLKQQPKQEEVITLSGKN